VTPAGGPAVLLDPMGEMAGTLSRLDDWFCFAEPDSLEAEIAVVAGAKAAGAIGVALDRGAGAAPRLYTPDGRSELAPLLLVPCDPRPAVAAVRRALLALGDGRPPGTQRALETLDRCATYSLSNDVSSLAAAARPGPASVRLDAGAYRSYQRFARAVLVDALDRFAALGSPATQPGLDTPAGPEVSL
jgi:hypothetical protein